MTVNALYPTVAPSLDLNFVRSGVLDSRVTFTRASTGTYFNSLGTLTTALTNVPRLDYNPSTLAAQGLLIEESRTNSIRNNTMVGASAGVAPTNWAGWNATTNGVTIASSAAGTENGIAYVDVAVSGTCTLTGTAQTPAFESATQIAATVGQTWTESVYWTLVSGSLADSSFNIRITETDAIGASLTSGDSAAIVPAVGNLRSARYAHTRTLTNASIAFVSPRLRFGFVNGTTYSFTLRVGLPQLELGAFATSVIPTTTVAVTRSADVASVNTLTPWYNATEGTLYAEYSRFGALNFQNIAAFGNAAQTEALTLVFGSGAPSNNQRFDVTAGGASQASISVLTTPALNTIAKTAGAYALNDFAATANGAAPGTDTSGTVPTVTTLGLGTGAALTGPYLNGYLRRITYFPVRLTNANLQAITT